MRDDEAQPTARRSGIIVPMAARSPDEVHRAATPLELFFDLVFVVAIAQAAERLHHGIAENHAAEALMGYGMAFFAIWWAWMAFTWFASAYDTDDVAYRLVVLLQLTGALILAAGVGRAFDARDFTIVTLGYVLMRIATVIQWQRAARADPERRVTAHRYSLGISALQIGWIGLLFVPQWGTAGFFVLVAGELLVPPWAERAGATPWHQGHIVERYGLLTIIVLGETILAASIAIRTAAQDDAVPTDLTAIIAGGILIVFSLWWLYFAHQRDDLRASLATAFVWGYGHLPIYASAAAVGAGIAVNVDYRTDHAAIGELGAGAAVAVPVAVYLLCLWALNVRPARDGAWRSALTPVFALLVLLTPWTGRAVLATGILTASLLALEIVLASRGEKSSAALQHP